MTQVILNYGVEQVYLSGIVENAFPADYLLWRNCMNVVFYDSTIRSLPPFSYREDSNVLFDSGVGLFDDVPGLFDEYTINTYMIPLATAPIYGLFQFVDFEGTVRTFATSADEIHEYIGSDGSVIGTSYSSPYWSFDNYGDWVFGTNGNDNPIVIKDSIITQPVEYPVTAVDLLVYRGHLLYFGVGEDRRTVLWSGYDEPEYLDPVTYPTAGQILTLKTKSGHIGAKTLDNYIIIYTQSEHLILEYVGYPNYFGARDTLPFGVINKRCIASNGNQHFCLSNAGCFTTNGYSADYLGDDAQRRYFISNADFSRKQDFFVVFDKMLGAIKFGYPNRSGNTEFFVYYFASKEFLKEAFDARCAILGVNERNLYGWADGNIYEQRYDLQSPLDINGIGVPSWIETKWISPGKEARRTYFDYLAPRLQSYGGTVVMRSSIIGENGVKVIVRSKMVNDKFGLIPRCPVQRDSLYATLQVSCDANSFYSISGLLISGKLAGALK